MEWRKTGGQIDRCRERELKDRWTDGQMDRWTDEQMDKQKERAERQTKDR
jgi:hypothetical protein